MLPESCNDCHHRSYACNERPCNFQSIKQGEVKRTGAFFRNPILPDEFDKLKPGDLVLVKNWPHIVIDAGPEQGNRIAAFREPYCWKVR
jgi:hypothetical protein